ncbi:MAG: MFS transporter [Candidatus Thorarchaeota archaeon]|jgi:MFS family permease
MATDDAEVLSQDQQDSRGFRAIIGRGDFMRLWFGQLVSNIGSAISIIALMFFAFELTGSPMAMALLAMVQVAPVILLAGVIGVYIDRWDRKRVMIASDIVRVGTSLTFPFVTLLPAILPPEYWLYLVAFIYATANAFFYPARNASIPNLVELEDLVPANSLSQMTYQLVTLIVTPIGGVIVALIRPDYFLAFAIDAVSFAVSAIAIWTISTSLVPKVVFEKEDSFFGELIEGARVIARSNILTFIILLFTVLMIGGGMVNALMIPFFEGELGFDSIQFSFIMSGGALSGILAAIFLGSRENIKRPLHLLAGAMVLAGAVLVGMAFVIDFLGAILLFSAVGLVNVAVGVPSNSLMQEIVDDKLRGRVFSFQSIMINTAQVSGMGLAGFWAETVGSSRPPIFAGGMIALLVGIVAFILISAKHMQSRLEDVRAARLKTEKSLDAIESDAISESPVDYEVDVQSIADSSDDYSEADQ